MALSKITNTGIDNITVDSGGNVGIGTTSPTKTLDINTASATFRIRNASAGNDFAFKTTAGPVSVIGCEANTSLALMTDNTERVRIDSSGNLLVGTTSTTPNPGVVFQPAGNITYGNSAGGSGFEFATFRRSATQIGSITQSGTTSVSYNTSSDYRLKENVTANWDATTRLKQLNPVRFNFIADADTTVDGFLAHEVQDIVPEAISGTKDAMRDEEYEVTPAVLDDDGNEVTPAVMGTRSAPDYQGIDQSKLVPLLVKTIQELEARIVALETA